MAARARPSRRVLLGLLAAASLMAAAAPSASAAKPSPSMTASPDPLAFEAVVSVTAPCTDGGCTYAMLTITNLKGSPQTITGVLPTSGVFFPTWGGTCAGHMTLKARESCTLEWGYDPDYPLTYSGGLGFVTFDSGASVSFVFYGAKSPL